MALVVKNLPPNAGDAETQVHSLAPEDPLEKCMATHSGILAWRIPWTEEFGGQRVERNRATNITLCDRI